MVLGLLIYCKNLGHIFNANLPGKLVPLCLVILRAIIDNLDIHKAKKNLILFIKVTSL
jgi:hypothetical protein